MLAEVIQQYMYKDVACNVIWYVCIKLTVGHLCLQRGAKAKN